jgi:hypothetical protein
MTPCSRSLGAPRLSVADDDHVAIGPNRPQFFIRQCSESVLVER